MWHKGCSASPCAPSAAPPSTCISNVCRPSLLARLADADLIFTAVKPKGAKRIGFEAFETALEKARGAGMGSWWVLPAGVALCRPAQPTCALLSRPATWPLQLP